MPNNFEIRRLEAENTHLRAALAAAEERERELRKIAGRFISYCIEEAVAMYQEDESFREELHPAFEKLRHVVATKEADHGGARTMDAIGKVLAEAEGSARQGHEVIVILAEYGETQGHDLEICRALGVRFETPESLREQGVFVHWRTLQLYGFGYRNRKPVWLVTPACLERYCGPVLRAYRRFTNE